MQLRDGAFSKRLKNVPMHLEIAGCSVQCSCTELREEGGSKTASLFCSFMAAGVDVMLCQWPCIPCLAKALMQQFTFLPYLVLTRGIVKETACGLLERA